MAATSKTVTLSGENVEGNTVELEIPATGGKITASNNITSFNRPNTNPQDEPDNAKETRSLNMNRIQLETQFSKAKVSDSFVDENHNGNGARPNLGNKEDWINEAWKLFLAGKIVELKAVNNDTYADTSEFSGYIHNLDWQEKAQSENSVYDVTIKLVDEIPMNS